MVASRTPRDPEDPKKELGRKFASVESSSGDPACSVQLFASLDLVNSTSFKVKTLQWPVVMDRFYNLAKTHICTEYDQSNSEPFRVWKYVGDEVLFCRTVSRLRDIPLSIILIFDKANEISREISSLCKQENYPSGLDVKGTVWIALIYGPDAVRCDRQQNIMVQLDEGKNPRNFDFLGPDIDSGFRVSGYADKRKVAISAKLGGVLLQPDCRKGIDSEFLSHFKIVYHARLKGVWHGSPYPIVWFHRDWDNINRTFTYLERLDPNIHDLGDYTAKQAIQNAINGRTSPLEDLSEVLAVHGETEDVQEIVKVIRATSTKTIKDHIEKIRHPQAEVHVATVVLSSDGGKVFLALRSKEKALLPEVWEFGCAQLTYGVKPTDLLSRVYKNDFDVDVKFPDDVPVGAYFFDRQEHTIPGFLYVSTSDPTSPTRLKSTHQDAKWWDIEDVNKHSESEFVPNLQNNIKKAIAKLKSYDTHEKVNEVGDEQLK